MRPLLAGLWTEPAVFLGAASVALNVAQTLTVHDRPVNAAIAAVSIAVAHAVVRQRVTPK